MKFCKYLIILFAIFINQGSYSKKANFLKETSEKEVIEFVEKLKTIADEQNSQSLWERLHNFNADLLPGKIATEQNNQNSHAFPRSPLVDRRYGREGELVGQTTHPPMQENTDSFSNPDHPERTFDDERPGPALSSEETDTKSHVLKRIRFLRAKYRQNKTFPQYAQMLGRMSLSSIRQKNPQEVNQYYNNLPHDPAQTSDSTDAASLDESFPRLEPFHTSTFSFRPLVRRKRPTDTI